MSKNLAFNTPYLTGKETHYIYDAVNNRKQLSGNGYYTKKCHDFFKSKFGFYGCLLTSSCTDALEMASILIDTNPNDEIIIPSYTFVSSALPFVMKGADIKFADSGVDHPNITLEEIKRLHTVKTKAVVIVHYAGQASELDKISDYCKTNNIFLIEDAAQAIDVTYKGKPVGSFGDLATFSFHETKNIISGEGGLLVVNNTSMMERAEVIWEKGTNRASFFRGEVNKYGWVDVGSSFLPSELTAAFLYAQLEEIEEIHAKRKLIWEYYYKHINHPKLLQLGIKGPSIPENTSNNCHIFYITCDSLEQRQALIKHFKADNILAVFHYLPLHKSEYYLRDQEDQVLENAERFADCLLRLPLHVNLTKEDLDRIIKSFNAFIDQQ